MMQGKRSGGLGNLMRKPNAVIGFPMAQNKTLSSANASYFSQILLLNKHEAVKAFQLYLKKPIKKIYDRFSMKLYFCRYEVSCRVIAISLFVV